MADVFKFAWPALFSDRGTPIEYLYQICCFYHKLEDSYTYLLHYNEGMGWGWGLGVGELGVVVVWCH